MKTRSSTYTTIIALTVVVGATLYMYSASRAHVQTDMHAVLPVDVASYVSYSPQSLENAKAKGTAVLFFAATAWCQTCGALDKEIVSRNKEIPPNMTILKVDYDHDREMNTQYRVTVQHTLVVIDTHGVEKARWVGGGLDELLKKAQTI